MMHGKEPDPAAAQALDAYWVTVMDHGMNASTFTARVIASTRSDLVSSVTGALGALKGPLHGGAPGPVLDMLLEFAPQIERSLGCNELAQGRRIMGFGHRVYKVRDPRAEVLSRVAERMGKAQLENRQLYELARAVEQTALRVLAEAKPGSTLRTNVEFYTALVLQALESAKAICGNVRMRPGRRMVRTRDRAARGRPADPPAIGIYRSGTGLKLQR